MKIYQDLVDFFDGQTKTAQKLNVSQPSVNAWIKGKAKMSPLIALRAERITEGAFKAQDLCPSVMAEIPNHQGLATN